MCLLIDNDVLHKLAHVGILESAIEAAGFSLEQCRILASAPYKFGVAGKDAVRAAQERKLGTECVEILRAALPRMKILDWEPDSLALESLQGLPNIDDGDAILAAACVARPSAWLTTGDKRFLVAIARHPELTNIAVSLRGRIKCFEQIISEATRTHGVEYMFEQIQTRSSCDIVLAIVFSDARERSEEAVLEALDSYTNHLRTETEGLV